MKKLTEKELRMIREMIINEINGKKLYHHPRLELDALDDSIVEVLNEKYTHCSSDKKEAFNIGDKVVLMSRGGDYLPALGAVGTVENRYSSENDTDFVYIVNFSEANSVGQTIFLVSGNDLDKFYYKFKLGDKVMVLNGEAGHYPDVGSIGEVVERTDYVYFVKFEKPNIHKQVIFPFWPDNLELVKDSYKIGDRVRITDAYRSASLTGQIGTIIDIVNGRTPYTVSLDQNFDVCHDGARNNSVVCGRDGHCLFVDGNDIEPLN